VRNETNKIYDKFTSTALLSLFSASGAFGPVFSHTHRAPMLQKATSGKSKEWRLTTGTQESM